MSGIIRIHRLLGSHNPSRPGLYDPEGFGPELRLQLVSLLVSHVDIYSAPRAHGNTAEQ